MFEELGFNMPTLSFSFHCLLFFHFPFTINPRPHASSLLGEHVMFSLFRPFLFLFSDIQDLRFKNLPKFNMNNSIWIISEQLKKKKSSIVIVKNDMNVTVGKKMNETCIGKHWKRYKSHYSDYLINFYQNIELLLINTCFKHKPSHLTFWQ